MDRGKKYESLLRKVYGNVDCLEDPGEMADARYYNDETLNEVMGALEKALDMIGTRWWMNLELLVPNGLLNKYCKSSTLTGQLIIVYVPICSVQHNGHPAQEPDCSLIKVYLSSFMNSC